MSIQLVKPNRLEWLNEHEKSIPNQQRCREALQAQGGSLAGLAGTSAVAEWGERGWRAPLRARLCSFLIPESGHGPAPCGRIQSFLGQRIHGQMDGHGGPGVYRLQLLNKRLRVLPRHPLHRVAVTIGKV